MERFKSKQLASDAEAGSRFMRIEEEFIDSEQHCEFCTRVEYAPGHQGLSGFSYETPHAALASPVPRRCNSG
jgi:hypothetical protein